jgi:hypothetical protein
VNRAVGSGGPNPKKDVVAEHIAQQRRRELYAQKAQLFDNDWDKHVLGRIAKDRKVESASALRGACRLGCIGGGDNGVFQASMCNTFLLSSSRGQPWYASVGVFV